MDTKKLLEHISNNCSSQLTKYKFNKGLDISDKYRKGKITSYTVKSGVKFSSFS